VVERRQASAPDSGKGGASRLSVARPARRSVAGHETLRLPAFRFLSFISFVIARSQRVRPEVAGPMTGTATKQSRPCR
jgi:hypothetical protein